jgi:hypothetical protein
VSAVVAPAPEGFGTGLTPTTATGSEFEVGEREMARSGAVGTGKSRRYCWGVDERNEEARGGQVNRAVLKIWMGWLESSANL